MLQTEGASVEIDLHELLRESKLTSESDDRTPTYAAVLMFHRRPDLLMHDACVVCRAATGLEQREERHIAVGTLPRQVEQTLSFLGGNLFETVRRTGAPKRVSDLEIPRAALRELVVNALVHRRYDIQQQVIVHVREDQIDIRNPGQFDPDLLSLPPEELWQGGRSQPVNPILAALADWAELAERSGSGFKLVRQEFDDAGLCLPRITVEGNTTVLVIPRPTETHRLAARSHLPPLLPLPPGPYLAHSYPMQENFTGRRGERKMLTDWVRGDAGHPLLSLVGMGGLGKSALAWYWVHQDLPQEGLDLAGTLWWSFYERDAGFDSFVSHALTYASAGEADPSDAPSDYERIQWLRGYLHDNPFLLILDGVERVLRAYARLDAAYRGCHLEQEGGEAHLLCADPRAGQLLQALCARGMQTKTLLTTRLHPKELDGLAGCRREDLARLHPDDAVDFLRSQGVRGPRNELMHACERYEFHPLCLRLLSGVIREDPARPGDIAVGAESQLGGALRRREHHILNLSYDTMAEDRRALLSRMAAMRSSLDYQQAMVLSSYENEEELKDALRELVARGLLLWDRENVRYDLHPIVRQHAYDRLGDRKGTHEVLKDYFAAVPKPDKVERLEDLTPAIELYHHTVSTGGYDEACDLLYERLLTPLYYQLGAYDVQISLLEALFPNGQDRPPRLKQESDHAWALNALASVCYTTGRSRRSAELIHRSNAIWEKKGNKRNLAIGLGNLAAAQILLGELRSAEENLRRTIGICIEVEEPFQEVAGHQELGRLLICRGEYGESETELSAAWRINAKGENEQGQCLICSYRALGALSMGDSPAALEALDKAREFWEAWRSKRNPVERDLVQILWLSGAAKAQMVATADAERDLSEALSRCRKIRLVELEADILLEMAKLRWGQANSGLRDQGSGVNGVEAGGRSGGLREEAKNLASEALEIADRCEYRLVQADVRNFLAHMVFDEGDEVAAREHAQLARERALCDGPPHCYRKALDEAEAMLDKLHATS